MEKGTGRQREIGQTRRERGETEREREGRSSKIRETEKEGRQ